MNNYFSVEPPIPGEIISRYLASRLNDKDQCVIKKVETLCSNNCEGLGRLWKDVSTRSVELDAVELISLLKNADQIVTLDFLLKDAPDRAFLIDDGELVENSL